MMTPIPMRLGFFASYRKQIFTGIGIGAGCAIAVFAALFFSGGPSVTSLDLSGDALMDHEVQMNVTVHNTGLLPRKYNAVVLADGEPAANQELTLAPGEQQTVTIPVAGLSRGPHTVEAGGMKADIKVLKPAYFTVESIDVQPKEVKPGDNVTVTAVISNAGEANGAFKAQLQMDGNDAAPVSASIAPNGEQTVTTVLKSVGRGSHTVSLGSESAQFNAPAPADITVKSLSLSTETAKAGSAVTAWVTLQNSGDMDGSYHIKLLMNGAVVNEQDVNVQGNGTNSVPIDVTAGKPGSYVFTANDQSSTLQVIQISRPKTGTLLVKSAKGGRCYIVAQNFYTNRDVIITLVKASDPAVPVMVVYVRAGEKTGKIYVKDGSYIEFYTYGSDMDSGTRKFISNSSYGKFDDPLVFKTTRSGSWIYWNYNTSIFGKSDGDYDSTAHSINSDEYPG